MCVSEIVGMRLRVCAKEREREKEMWLKTRETAFVGMCKRDREKEIDRESKRCMLSNICIDFYLPSHIC